MKSLMKFRLGLLASIVVLALGCLGADEGYREFTAKDGKKIRVRILKYDKRTDMVKMERENRKRYTVSPDVFCEADRNIIRNWALVERFMSDSGLKVSVKRSEKIVEDKTTEKNGMKTRLWLPMDVHYAVTLQNRTDLAFDNIKIKVVSFTQYEQLYPDRGVDKKFKIPADKVPFDVGTIKPSGKAEIATPKHGGAEQMTVTYKSKVINKDVCNSLQGVWIRITMELPGGGEVVRDIQEQAELWEGIDWSAATQMIDLKTMKTYASLGDYQKENP